MEFIQGKWSLNDLYPEGNKEAFQAELDQLKQKAEAFTAVRGELQASLEPKRFLEILKNYAGFHSSSKIFPVNFQDFVHQGKIKDDRRVMGNSGANQVGTSPPGSDKNIVFMGKRQDCRNFLSRNWKN